jgi:hypothetical protein
VHLRFFKALGYSVVAANKTGESHFRRRLSGWMKDPRCV